MKFNFDSTKLKSQIEDNPLLAVGVFAAAATAASKLLNANSERKRTKIYDREIKRRTLKDLK